MPLPSSVNNHEKIFFIAYLRLFASIINASKINVDCIFLQNSNQGTVVNFEIIDDITINCNVSNTALVFTPIYPIIYDKSIDFSNNYLKSDGKTIQLQNLLGLDLKIPFLKNFKTDDSKLTVCLFYSKLHFYGDDILLDGECKKSFKYENF